ncbi:tetratricopeptide repeat protein [Skeletonema marinoi]|uniref:Tetratricopeptide repeat protein n=1 Tax=Skeletonema marinoi TaxID=267567 RepID=A0AAD8YI79_9STRA|nr:tetratricopeptide repeat protein [Skeletonema marinoi]
MASTTSSSAETTQPNNNRQQQSPPPPPTQPLVSKSKIDSQIEQLENKQNVQKQQQKQRYHKKKGTESQPSSSTTTSKKKRTSKKKHRSNNNNNKQRCSIAQNKKRQVRHLYTKAKQLEKRGSWREASDMYEHIVRYYSLRMLIRIWRGGGTSLLQTALDLDPNNGYVCHAYGLLEHTMGEVSKAKSLWQQGLVYQPSAALVCSLGEMYVASGDFHSARELYSTYLHKLPNGRERTEVYLAAASLEERVYNDVEKASELLRRACSEGGSSGREEGGGGGKKNANLWMGVLTWLWLGWVRVSNYHEDSKKGATDNSGRKKKTKKKIIFPVNDGRLFNAWAKMESKSGNLSEARKILGRGMELYPKDYTLLQAAGNIEERLGNIRSARDLYGASLSIEPSAPTLIAYALLELRSPIDIKTKASNVTMVRKLFEEALLIDPKHGPAYNAYGNLERRQGNTAHARQIYEDGIKANCTDAPSYIMGWQNCIYHSGRLFAAGIEKCPHHVPLYQAWACLELQDGDKRVYSTLKGLPAEQTSAEIFQSDANAPPTDEQLKAMERQMKHGRSTRMPDGITALAEKIGVESDEPTTIAGVSMDDVDLDSLVNNVLCGFGGESGMMLQEGPM